jgi:hypothetical protein
MAPLSGIDLQIRPPRDGMNAPITIQHEQANIQIFSIVVRMAIYGWVEY